jgi:hypothetical protein
MVELNTGQRELLADKLAGAANLAIGALVFGQLLSDRPSSWLFASSGFMMWSGFFGWAAYLKADSHDEHPRHVRRHAPLRDRPDDDGLSGSPSPPED